MIIAEVSITPLGTGVSVSKYVRIAYEKLKTRNLKLMLTPMSTIIEAQKLEDIFDAVKDAEEAVLNAGAKRVIISMKIDHRIDKDATMDSKIDAVIGKEGGNV